MRFVRYTNSSANASSKLDPALPKAGGRNDGRIMNACIRMIRTVFWPVAKR